MTLEHEIPAGSRLYFGKSAALKRKVEGAASEILITSGFEQIVTPYFSYLHQQNEQFDQKSIKLSGEENDLLCLRTDSSLDAVRLITKRLGRTTDHKKWFYIQPVFYYPSFEVNQVGAEHIDCKDTADIAKLALSIFDALTIKPVLQLSNRRLAEQFLKEINQAHSSNFDEKSLNQRPAEIKKLGLQWANHLLDAADVNDLQNLPHGTPQSIIKEAELLTCVADKIGYKKTAIAPLYMSKTGYYCDIFFRLLHGNELLCKGGGYYANEVFSAGFALYTDNIIGILEDE